jgi:hypothetical protein
VGRAYQYDWPGSGAGQRRQQQPPLILGAVGLQNFYQCSHRPTATGQLRIERGMASGQHAASRLRKGIGTPDAGMGVDRNRRGHGE